MKPSTSLSLLEQARLSGESDGWNRLFELYTPIIKIWLHKYSVQEADLHDLTQEVLLAVSQELPNFEHNGNTGAFRSWLKQILINRLRKHWRSRDRGPQPAQESELEAQLERLSDPSSELSQLWNSEHDRYVLRELMTLAEPNFTPATWQAFCRVALDGADPQTVANEIGISRNAVIVAKCRVLNRLRQESVDLVDSNSDFLGEC